MAIHEFPKDVRVAALASIAVAVTVDQVLRSQYNIGSSAGQNAQSVGECFSCTESPTRTALSLVEDGVDAVRPFFAYV